MRQTSIIQHLIFTFFCLSGFLGAANSHAHEPRIIADGIFSVSVGWLSEPAYEDVINGFNININAVDETGNTTAVNASAGDTVDLSVKLLYLETDSMEAEILADTMLKDAVTQIRGTENRYQSRFKPTHDGAYGYHVTGTINGVNIDETFICGGGSQHEGGRAFGCVVDPQNFPGDSEDGYKDNDEFDD